ncbi:MAG: winged helix-turn-helix domain-containing protein [Pseudomonadota bacterium]
MTTRIEIDPVRQTVRFGMHETALPNYSFQLLRLLMSRAPDPVRFEEIEQTVWGAQVSRDTIKQRVRLLRNSLSDIGAPQDAIQAARSVGYRLSIASAPVAPPPLRNTKYAVTAAAALIVLVGVAFVFLRATPESNGGPLRIAVVNELALRDPEKVDTVSWLDANRLLASQLSQLQGVEAVATAPMEALGSVRSREAARRLSADMIVSSALMERGDGVRLWFQLIDGSTEVIIRSDDYEYRPDRYVFAVEHFIANVHSALARTDRQLQRLASPLPRESERNAYFEALEIAEIPKEENLLTAIEKLGFVIEQEPAFVLARSLRARLRAELVIRYGYGADVAEKALHEAQSAVAQAPAIVELKYALARAEIAIGDDRAALAHLNEISRYLPFVAREIAALERRMS